MCAITVICGKVQELSDKIFILKIENYHQAICSDHSQKQLYVHLWF